MSFSFKIIIITLLSIFSVSGSNKISIPLHIYYLAGSGWDSKVIQQKLDQANEIMAECDLMIDPIQSIQEIHTGLTDGSIDLLGDSNRDQSKLKENEINLHQLISAEKGDNKLRMFFVGAVPNLISIFGTSRRVELHADELYVNSTYISNQLGTESSDVTIAHELGHVLLNEGHYHADPAPNIMHYQYTQQSRSFNTQQCQKMKESFLLKPPLS